MAPARIKVFETTPNPHALKCVLDRPIEGPIRSYRDAAEAAEDPLARALFAVQGIAGVLINPSWIAVNKVPEATWSELKVRIKDALAGVDADEVAP